MEPMRTMIHRGAWAITLVLGLFALLRAIATVGTPNLVLIAAVTPMILLAAFVLAAYAFLTNKWLLLIPTVALSLLSIFWLSTDVNLFPSSNPGQGLALRVVTANLSADANPDPQAAFSALAATGADVILLQEVDAPGLASMQASPDWARYPHRVLDAREGFFGSAIVSTRPMTGDVLWVDGWPMTEGQMTIDSTDIRIINVHVVPPLNNSNISRWQAQLHELSLLADATLSPLIIGGDFNATLQHPPLQDLYDAQLSDAFLEAGRGLGATWPVGHTSPRPFLRLDRVLFNDELHAVDAQYGPDTGSDHRSVMVDLELLPQ